MEADFPNDTGAVGIIRLNYWIQIKRSWFLSYLKTPYSDDISSKEYKYSNIPNHVIYWYFS